MKILKPKFWDKSIGFFSIIFLPLTILIIFLVFIKKKLGKYRKFDIPIICVGNIYVGGTGKTPLTVIISNMIKNKGKNPVIVRKYYRKHKDEHYLLKENFKNVILNKNRSMAIEEAVTQKFDCAVLDDGFQDYEIKKDLNIICFNQNQLIGNGLVFPSGPLRETLKSIKYAQIVMINGEKDENFEKKILKINKSLKIYYSLYEPLNIKEFKEKKLLAFAGIGNPTNFFKLLEKQKLNVEKKFSYPDHYDFKKNEISNIVNYAKNHNLEIITTEKDFFKVKKYNFKEIKYLIVDLKIEKEEEFLNHILKIYDKDN